MATIFVVDTAWIGHIPTYHKLIVEAYLSLNYEVISISPKELELQQWRETLSEGFRRKLTLKSLQIKFPLEISGSKEERNLRRALHWWKCVGDDVKSAAKEKNVIPKVVFLPGIESNIISRHLTGDMVDEQLPYPWVGLYMTPKYLRKSFLKYHHKQLMRKDKFFDAKNCAGIAVLDEGIIPRLKKNFPTKKIYVMPDATFLETFPTTPTIVEEIRRLASGRIIVGAVGELSSRKGIFTLLEVAKRAETEKRDLFFVFAGPMNSKNNSLEELAFTRDVFKKAPKNCFLYFERIDDERIFNSVIKSCDIVFAAYENFYHSSNILTKAAHFKKPIIVSRGYCMAERVSKFYLGKVVPENDVNETLGAIEALSSLVKVGAGTKSLHESFCQFHSKENLVEFLKKLGGTPDEKIDIVTSYELLAQRSCI